MKFEELRKEHLIFSYKVSPGTGIEGEDGGFSIELYGNGNLRYCTYVLFDEINTLEMFKLTREQVKEIYDIIETYREALERIPVCLDNGKVHKNANEFQFLGREKIWAWDIKRHLIPLVYFKDRAYYEQYKENMEYENLILDVFQRICFCVRKFGISLSLRSCKLREDCKVRVTWK